MQGTNFKSVLSTYNLQENKITYKVRQLHLTPWEKKIIKYLEHFADGIGLDTW